MELMTEQKKEFKKTEVGLIPEDWKVYTFSQLFDFLKTGSLSRRYLSNNGDTYYIHYGDIHAKWKRILDFDKSDIPKVSSERVRGLPTLEEGDLIIADASEDYEGVGASVEVKNINGKTAVSGLHTILLRGKKELIVDGLKAYLTHIETVRDRLKKVSTGTTVFGISKSKLGDVKIPLPPTLVEQQAIASALSDVDELIRSLDRLIEKKEAIKKGTMQLLLTGKKRLPGFDGGKERVKTEFGLIPKDWDLISLEEATVNSGLIRGPFGGALKKEFFVDRGIKVYEQKNAIYKATSIGNYYISEDKFRELARFEVKPDDFIVSCSGTIGKIFRIPTNAPKGIINQALLIIRIDDRNMSLDYFNHYFSWNRFQERIIDNTHGGAMKNLVGMDKFRNTLMPAPALKEQKAIAKILSDMDEELQTLRQKREKMRRVKEGMMQELLTGKTRLV